jgi:transcription antitermination factor NusG
MTDWYVVQTKPRLEEAVNARLRLLGAETYLPRMYESVRAGLRLQRRLLPIFPSYLFVRTNLDEQGIRVRYTPGVRDFVRCAGVPQPLGPSVVEALRARVGPSDIYNPPPRRFAPGEYLRISDGPLRGLSVVFERELTGTERAAVLLAEVRWSARVVLPQAALAAT